MAEPKRINNTPDDSPQAANDSQYDSPEARRKDFKVIEGGKSKSPLPPPKKKEPLPEVEEKPNTSVAKSDERITQSDRSYLNKPFFEESDTNRVGRVTVDEKFSKSYEQTGLQPSYASQDPRIKNVRVREKYAEAERQAQAANAQYQAATQTAAIQPRTQVNYQQTRGQTATKAQKNKKKGKTKKTDRLKANAVNSGIVAIALPSWFFLQFPLAILNLVFLGLAAAWLAVTEGVMEITDGDGVVSKVVSFVFGAISAAFEAINDAIAFLTGVDIGAILEALNPTNFYFMTILLLFAYAMVLLLTIGLVYTFAGINCLSGRAGGAKIMSFLLCLAGYTIPFLNLFPWFLVWTTVVWKNPK